MMSATAHAQANATTIALAPLAFSHSTKLGVVVSHTPTSVQPFRMIARTTHGVLWRQCTDRVVCMRRTTTMTYDSVVPPPYVIWDKCDGAPRVRTRTRTGTPPSYGIAPIV